MEAGLFDGGGSFEQLYWTGEDSSGKAPRNTTDKRMEISDGSKKKDEKKKDGSEAKKKDGSEAKKKDGSEAKKKPETSLSNDREEDMLSG